MRYVLMFLIALALTTLGGCATGGPSGRIVAVLDGHPNDYAGRGHGAIIGPHQIVTAYHVVDGVATSHIMFAHASKVYSCLRASKWHAMTLKEIIVTPGNREPLAILEVEGDKFLWCQDDIFTLDDGKPYKAITGRGTFLWDKYVPTKGDSGSPVVNRAGNMIGVIYGGRIGEAGTGILLRMDPKHLNK